MHFNQHLDYSAGVCLCVGRRGISEEFSESRRCSIAHFPILLGSEDTAWCRPWSFCLWPKPWVNLWSLREYVRVRIHTISYACRSTSSNVYVCFVRCILLPSKATCVCCLVRLPYKYEVTIDWMVTVTLTEHSLDNTMPWLRYPRPAFRHFSNMLYYRPNSF